jgi:hypothetical protein
MKLLYMTNLLKYFNRKKVCFHHVQPELIPSGFSYFDKHIYMIYRFWRLVVERTGRNGEMDKGRIFLL